MCIFYIYWTFWACLICRGHFFLLFLDVKHTVFNVIWQANYTQSIRQLDCRFYRQYNISSTTSTKVNTCWKWKRNYKYIPIYVYTPSGSHWWHILTHYNLIAGLEIITHEHNIMYLNWNGKRFNWVHLVFNYGQYILLSSIKLFFYFLNINK